FLLFARPEQFIPSAVSLEEVCEAAVAETKASFGEIPISRDGEFPEILGSPVLLRRALANLLRNAVQATPPARPTEPEALLVRGGRNEAEATLTVGDRGVGIDTASREKIFLPFYSSKPSGAGFGLAIVARIAELHGGTVEVTARPGGGSFFTLRLSLGAPPQTPPAGEPKSVARPERNAVDLPDAAPQSGSGGWRETT